VLWNLSELKTILKEGLSTIKGIQGVTSPYMYIGAWKTFFAWHKEDMDLYSINYNHLGKQKFWYSVPLNESKKFEEFMQKSYPEAFKECPEFLRHKTYFVHPEVLLKNGIKLHK
jgi:jumonji domain-containing protein 2